jgi:2'-5' RNA ligase
VARRIVVAYWLIPAEPAYSFFQGIINDLARRYNAPIFEPHVTIHVANRVDTAEEALSSAAHECHPIELKVGDVGHSDEFIKTLYVEFALSSKMRRLNRVIRDAAHDASGYELKPHLSLLYKKVSSATRRELAASINVPFSEAAFDRLKAVRCVSPTQGRVDVEAWRVVTTQQLAG